MHPLDTCFRAARSVLSAFMGSVLAMCATVSAQTSLSSNDFTGDGIADTVVAVEGFDSTTPRSGSVSIGISPTGQTLLSISGPGVNDRFARTAGGWRIAATGAPDLVVTAPALNGAGANSSGAVFVFLVPAGQLRYSITAQSNHRFGDRAAVISDQNADGFGELLVEGAELINGQWFYRTYLHSGASGALLAKYDVVIDSIVRFAGSGGRAYAQADLNNNGFVDQEDLLDIAGGVGEVAGPGDARDLDGSGEIDSIDVFEAVSAMLRGDTTIVASGALIQSYSDWTAAQDRWNVLNGSSALASSLTNVDTGGGVGGTPGLFPCDPNSIGEVNPNCVAQLQGCPSRPISIGEQFVLGSGVYNGPGSSCSIEVVDDGSPASVVETAPGYFQAVAAGCTTVRLICTTGGGQTCCQACEICVAAGPTCPTPLLWTGCPESFEAISTVGDVVLRTYLQNYQTPVSVEWTIELLGAGMDVCQIPDDPALPGDPNAACANWTCLGCPSGQELRLANHPHFAAILQQLIAISNTEDSRTLCVRFRTTETILTASGTATCVLCGTCPIQVGLKDSDGDGLIDVIEPGYNADPLLPDTDDDGFCDGDEVRAGSLPNLASSVPTVGRQDVDLDGLPDGEDIRAKKLYNPEDGRPEVFDNDFDGVPDPSELELGLNPLTEFTAGQGAPDLLSAAWAQSDFDQDRLADKYELRLGLDPRVRDMDGDGIADGIEVQTGTNPTTSHRHESADFDGDGLSDYEELTFYFSDPSSRDSDRDGLSDAFEVRAGLDPTRAYSRARTINGQSFPGVADRDADLDYDGLSNHAESRFGTDPLLHDTDGDGASDGEEVGVGGQGGGTGGDPLDPSDGGNGDSENYCWIMITVGGHWPGMCDNGANNQSLWNTGDVRTIEGSIGGGINDQKHPHTWTVTIGSGSGGGSSGGGGGGSLLPISTGPNGEREIAFRRFRRGACITVTIGDGTRVNYGGALNGLFVGMLPVDMTQPGAPACGDSCAVDCCLTQIDDYDDPETLGANEQLLGNHCNSAKSPAQHTATVCISALDLDIDSDNNDFTELPDGREESIEDAGFGKLVEVRDGDVDVDGIPDWADGFKFDAASFGLTVPQGQEPEFSQILHPGDQRFVPLTLTFGVSEADSSQTVRFTYEASDPAGVTRTLSQTTQHIFANEPFSTSEYTYTLPSGTGRFRLWKRPGNVPRDPRSIVQGGDFIPSGTPLPATLFGVPGASVDTTLYLEAVRPTLGSHADTVTVEVFSTNTGSSFCPDTVRVSAIQVRHVKATVQTNGTAQYSEVSSPAVSTTGPRVDLLWTVTNLRTSPDNSKIIGDIVIDSTIDDFLSNLASGNRGQVKAAMVVLNGEPLKRTPDSLVEGIEYDVVKSATRTADPLNPYPFHGSTSNLRWLHGIELQAGWNSLELVARNFAGLPGSAEAGQEIVADIPATDFEATLTPTSWPAYSGTAGQLTIRRTLMYSTNAETQESTFNMQFEDFPPRWVSPDIPGLEVEMTAMTGGQWLATVNGNPLWHVDIPISLVQHPGLTGTPDWHGTDLIIPSEQSDLRHARLSLGEITATTAYDGGDQSAYFTEVLGPDPLLESAIANVLGSEYKIEATQLPGDTHIRHLLHNPDVLALTDSAQHTPVAFVATPNISEVAANWPVHLRSYYAKTLTTEYARSFTYGVFDGALLSYWDDTKNIVGVLQNASAFFQTHTPFAILVKTVRTGDPVGSALSTIRTDAELLKETGNSVLRVAYYTKRIKDNLPLITYAITIRDLGMLDPDMRQVAELVVTIADSMVGQMTNATPAELGEMHGYIVGQVLQLIVEEGAAVVLTAGTATGVVIAKRSTILLKMADALEVGPRLAKVRLALGAGLGQVVARVREAGNALLSTNLCFVAGTLVHTSTGLVPIESVRVGDLVLARHEQTGEIGYFPVVDTIITRPRSVLTVSWSTDSGEQDSVTGTPEHPFWVKNRGEFVEMGELERGDVLVLADGRDARVIEVAGPRGPPRCDTSEWNTSTAEPLTTYNIEVADAHTYFVGRFGALVHNSGVQTCEEFAELVLRVQRRDQSTLRQAFEKVLRMSNPQLQPVGSIELANAKRHYARYKKHLLFAANEVMQDAYTRGTLPGVDWHIEVPTAKNLYEALGCTYAPPHPSVPKSFWNGPFLSKSDVQVHHGPGKAQARALLERRGEPYSSYTAAQWEALFDTMPGYIINKKSLDARAGPRHQLITNELRSIKPQNMSPLEFFQAMQNAYSLWDPIIGPKVWAVSRQWYESHGVIP